MGQQYTQKIWKLGQAVAQETQMANPKRWGAVPFDIRKYKSIMPTLMHGKKITFGDRVSEKGKNHTRRAFIPNVLFKPLYSRSLGMSVWSCVSATALREIDAWGGFDEYIVGVSQKNITDKVANMYRARIIAAMNTPGSEYQLQKSKMLGLLAKNYSAEYADSLA